MAGAAVNDLLERARYADDGGKPLSIESQLSMTFVLLVAGTRPPGFCTWTG